MRDITKRTSHLGRSFDSESDLIETVKNNLSLFLPSSTRLVVTQEVRIGAGIVDILVGRTNDTESILNRLNNNKTRLEKLEGIKAVVISCLYFRRPLSAKTVSRKCGLPYDTVYKLLEELVLLGFCNKPSSNTYILSPISKQFNCIVAIEGKLSKWRVALKQAYRNQLFSTFSYVVLDKQTSNAAISNIDLFISHRVGLALADAASKNVEIVYKPRCIKPISSVFSILASEALFSSINNNDIITPEGLDNGL